MIVTLTPNPSVDRAVTVQALQRGEVLRAAAARVDAGGKGVNVSRALAAAGEDTLVVLPSGGPEGSLLEALLERASIRRAVVPIPHGVRMNISVLEPDGTTTKLNEPGPRLSEADVEALLEAALAPLGAGDWVAGCGSLPPGAPGDLYATLVRRAKGRGARVAIDTSGAPLAEAIPAAPSLIKPNREELAEFAGRPLETLGAVIGVARELVAGGIELVAVSLGRDGAVLVTAEEAVHARAFVTDPVSTVGAGDCMLAGLLSGLARGEALADALAEGVRWGAAAVRLPGTEVPRPGDLSDIDVALTADPDTSLPLHD
ncbi:1-phosphofructokinase [Leucobacter sp. wl10]|uniref:1-phosphofructokinase n=1 Tax=Leucobacter sp. wl10 TaxID=2304677 RepID=UPI000E5AF2F3|nr:1-phosphofructokinase [Leucobacter sp. wl10]RGE22473.1 1-phosphofructokinase [Leucobacter sp. wl10]